MNNNFSDLPSLREIADALFRRKAFLAVSTLLLLAAVAAVWQITGNKYESQMVLLVRNNRADVVVTPGQAAAPQMLAAESQLATEIQLLLNRGSLRKVVQRARLLPEGAEPAAIDKRATALERAIKITPNAKANIITVRYTADDPQTAARVLQELLAVYTDQHIRVHKGSGTNFFEQQATEQAARLKEAQARLTAFQRNEKIVLLNEQKDLNLRRLMDLEAAARESQLAIREGNERIASLQEMAKTLTPRITTQVRNIPNQYLVERLHTMLAELENKRTTLLAKFRADDRLVREVELQIADTRATLDRATRLISTEQASDINPLRQSLDSDLARARTAQQVLKARTVTLASQVKEYKREIAGLERATASYNDLVREVKNLEENYQLYARKSEEARIANALDEQKVANVTVVDVPEVPAAPVPRSSALLIGAILLGLCLIVSAAVISGIHGQELYTPRAVYLASGIQVLATVPEKRSRR